MPFFFKLYMFGTITLFEQAIYALKHNEVFGLLKIIVALTTFYFNRIYEFFGRKINT